MKAKYFHQRRILFWKTKQFLTISNLQPICVCYILYLYFVFIITPQEWLKLANSNTEVFNHFLTFIRMVELKEKYHDNNIAQLLQENQPKCLKLKDQLMLNLFNSKYNAHSFI